MAIKPSYLVGIALSALLCLDGMAATPPASPPPSNGVPQIGQRLMGELKRPEFAASRCMLTPLFSTDQMTVAVSTDRVFSAGDIIIAVGDDPIDSTAKTPVRDLLMKYGPTETLAIKIRRADKELVVTAKCADAKPFYDLQLEGAFAASKSDFATCADKMTGANRLHNLGAHVQWLAFQCARQAGRMVGSALAQGYYEVHRQLILESAWSSDSLGGIRGTILSAVDTLQKNNASLLGDDLKQQYDQALSAKNSSPITVSANVSP